ncbi:precorrin-6y C5,15-methyltransferase, CbiE subunit [Peptoanaerobacter stomatis]|uniref:Precorrin-6y C5,15-methyltransferase, CbiE subunit n=1 Tax=Peptoanaerobacter stomatis TaxID=796937 RepID=G9XFK4_9FIRM|nr:precorrin-6y C5,15-methyltransferase (decarboxylating) subunit CbiE [Peptoanaerobacter stomatis]EHL16729.1 precorrin-6y C5,15-methyltransferase, CbiE subunit [Peptoanaerobacter stomatis]
MINIVGIGLGDRENITLKAIDTIKNSKLIIGAKRQIQAVNYLNKDAKYIEYVKLEDIIKNIKYNIDKDICVLASGEPNLYGISNYIIENMKPYEDINIISGISSVAYLFAEMKISMNDVYITSFHGRQINEEMILMSKKTAFFTDSKTSVYDIAQIYLKNNKNPKFIIGENLSYNNEKITIKYANEITKQEIYKMYILISILN